MATVTLRNVRMRGLVSCVPKTVLSNLDFFEERKPERERLVRNIGIQTRRMCYPWQYFSDLAKAAAEKLLEAVGWSRVRFRNYAFIRVDVRPGQLLSEMDVTAVDEHGREFDKVTYRRRVRA